MRVSIMWINFPESEAYHFSKCNLAIRIAIRYKIRCKSRARNYVSDRCSEIGAGTPDHW